jgi:N-acetylneuraminic acid mutarotase
MNYGRAFHATALLNDGRVLVAGGFDNELRTLSSSEVYDPDTQTWTLVDDMEEPRFFVSASVLHDGRVLVVGGSNNSTGPAATHKTAEIYDPISSTWSRAGQLAVNRTGHSATVMKDGRVLVVGGGGLDSNLARAEIYDPEFNEWSPAGIMTLARAGHSAALMSDGRVIVAGGWSDSGSAGHIAEIYDPRVGTWFAMAVTP